MSLKHLSGNMRSSSHVSYGSRPNSRPSTSPTLPGLRQGRARGCSSETQLHRPGTRSGRPMRSNLAARNLALGDAKMERALPNLQSHLGSPPAAMRRRKVIRSAEAWSSPESEQGLVRTASFSGSGQFLGKPLQKSLPQRKSRALPVQGRAAPAAAEEPRDEASALRSIWAVANTISEDLVQVFKACEMMGEDYSGDTASLREISGTSSSVKHALNVQQDRSRLSLQSLSPPTSPTGPAATGSTAPSPTSASKLPARPYDDPMLAKARKLNAMTVKICEELDDTRDNFGQETRDFVESNSLHEISSATRKVCEDMQQLLGQPWAGGGSFDLQEEETLMAAGEGEGGHNLATEEESTEKEGLSADAPDSGRDNSAQMTPMGSTALNRDMFSIEGLPPLQEFLSNDDEFSDADIQRYQAAFKRFKVPDSNELHAEDVCTLLGYLGHVMTAQDEVFAIVKEVTAYDYLDFDEFLTLMEKFVPYEKERFHDVFKKYDEDNSGEIDIDEIKCVLVNLGFIPLHAMLVEGLSIVDTDNNGTLDFQEFVTFLAVYRRAEGFATSEVKELRQIFDHFSKESEDPGHFISAEVLSNALVQGFGLHVKEYADKQEDEMKKGSGIQKSSFVTGASSGKSEVLTFSEFLIFCRKTRKASMERLRTDYPKWGATGGSNKAKLNDVTLAVSEEFAACDLDGNGKISELELRLVLTDIGYTPLKQTLDEIYADVDKDNDRELDFTEFFEFLLVIRQREGFRKAQVDEMRRTFKQFDSDGSGEISAIELADLFRELGYRPSMDEIHMYVQQVDANNSGDLDFREYLRLMQIHRESELKKISAIYKRLEDKSSKSMLRSCLKKALTELGEEVSDAIIKKQPSSVDFEYFVKIADQCRAERVMRERKKAGFSDERIETFREQFDRIDKDKSNEIDAKELQELLTEFGWQPKSREEQATLQEKMNLARQRAREAGVKEVGPDGWAGMKFWPFIQLARMLETEKEQAEEQRMSKLMDEIKFSQREVEEFRQVFIEKKRECARDLNMEKEFEGLPRDGVRRLMRQLGVTVKGDRKGEVDNELEKLGCPVDGLLEFAGFLRLMKWLVDSGWLAL